MRRGHDSVMLQTHSTCAEVTTKADYIPPLMPVPPACDYVTTRGVMVFVPHQADALDLREAARVLLILADTRGVHSGDCGGS